MNNLNSVLLEGYLTRDPLLSETPKGTSVCTFCIGVNRYYKQDEEVINQASFFDVETWTRLAQYCGSQLKKGQHVRIVGRLKQDRWEDSEGRNRSRVKIIGEHLELPENREQEEKQYALEEVGEMVHEKTRELKTASPG